jgi:D-alanine--D-alanine ligase
MKVAILCGGPSRERGISLNSARSVMDHLSSNGIDVTPYYFDARRHAYRISPAQLYSNTPSDFDFKLRTMSERLTRAQFLRQLRRVNLAFPVMHGAFGEDGAVQALLEQGRIPFVGSSSASCRAAFDKYTALETLRRNGFHSLPSLLLRKGAPNQSAAIRRFFSEYQLERAIVKPAGGGSSIGVYSVSAPREALERARSIFDSGIDRRVVVEPFARGKEFTVIVLENPRGVAVALPPTEIETSYENNEIFDFRKKYLPTHQVTWHCPPRFDDDVVRGIQSVAEKLFGVFRMRDFARFDGWLLDDGNIWFCDFNPISGMEQNSFLFQQAGRCGMTHADVLRYIVRSACRRSGIAVPRLRSTAAALERRRTTVNVLFGGDTSERQVSLMSGTNVWLKLRRSRDIEPRPFLLDVDGNVWRLPYHLALSHTVEEIAENCRAYSHASERLRVYETDARDRLLLKDAKDTTDFFPPERLSLGEFIDASPHVFIALHGGDGENGVLQGQLHARGVRFNGPGASASRLCMDKYATARFIDDLAIPSVRAIPGEVIATDQLLDMNAEQLAGVWRGLRRRLAAVTLIVKPRADGCSTGIAPLFSPPDLRAYVAVIRAGGKVIPKGTLHGQTGIIEMPPIRPPELLFEPFITTDVLEVRGKRLHHSRRSGWLEITTGVLEDGNTIRAFNPSMTPAEGKVLSVEEKFQGGTGVNITPPPQSLMRRAVVAKVRRNIACLATLVGIQGYSRIDAFVHTSTGDLQIIEINTLPGLTPSTVFYQQGLAERPPLYPRDLLEHIVRNSH